MGTNCRQWITNDNAGSHGSMRLARYVLVLVTIFAVAFALREHNHRVLPQELTQTGSELQDTRARIANLRDAEMKNMDDYIRAFSEIGLFWSPTIGTCRGLMKSRR